ncbi:hypothetical protein BW737_006200 [Actinomyces ruminis]|uniref:Uncharacterized protein n=1 Tax=Actinomyces ruminis TaxID=1937003 RepID=A0ABX4MBL4_9ACTO|nr:hypothetical protein BW737_006200 [Actinomyces ruminis]
MNAFKRHHVDLELPLPTEGRFQAGIRHRRVDSWSAATRQPRATRTAIQAGSVLNVAIPDAASGKALNRLAVTGIGDLTAQGFGRFVVGHELLNMSEFALGSLSQQDFIGTHTTRLAGGHS